MLWLIAVASAMLINPASRYIMMRPRLISTRLLTDNTRLREVQTRLRYPIAAGLQASSWFHDRSDVAGFPLYLLSYATDHEPMLAEHEDSIEKLQETLLKEGDEGNLAKWAVEASNAALERLPDDTAKLLRVYYLDLLATASKLTAEERMELAKALMNTPSPSSAHLSEIYSRFILEYHQVKKGEHREAIISDCSPKFLADLIITGREEMIEAMRVFIPALRKDEELLQRSLMIWSEANDELSRAVDSGNMIPSNEHVSFMFKAYKSLVYRKHLGAKQKKALRAAGRFIAAHCNDIWEIYLVSFNYPLQDKE